MTESLILPVVSMAFGSIAGLTRNTRAELTEALTSDYMLLARTKGLTKSQSIVRHALKNAMVPILPGILSGFLGILSGSMIIEQIFLKMYWLLSHIFEKMFSFLKISRNLHKTKKFKRKIRNLIFQNIY